MKLSAPAWLLLLCSSAAAQSGPLYPGPLYVSDDAPSPIVAADMNGDGIKDLVVGNANNTFSIFLGTATGTFGAPSTFAAGGAAAALAVADFNADGTPDVAIAHALLATTISVALSDGLGGYGAPTDYAVGAGAGHLAAGDFDGDGKQDLVVTNSNAASISILLGNGTGGFAAAVNQAVGAQPHGIVALDLSADGKLDLATANYSGSATILLGTGAGTFNSLGNSPANGFADMIAAGDVNADGKPDLAISNFFGATNVSVLIGMGAGVFGLPVALTSGAIFPADVRIGDATGDGLQDVLLVSLYPDEVQVFAGNGAGGFGAAQHFLSGKGPSGLVVGDWNGDGRLDAAATSGGPLAVCVLLGKSGGLEAASSAAVGSDAEAVASGDFNNDGKRDVVAANSTSNDFSLVLGDATGNFGAPTNFAAGTTPAGIAAGDLNADGKLDVVVANSGSGTITVHLGTGTGSFGALTSFSVGTTPVALALADLNNNGQLDVCVVNAGSNNVTVRLGNGAGSFGAATNFAVGTAPRALALADFNANGVLDLAVANSGSNNVSSLLGNGTGGFTPFLTFNAGTFPRGIAAADFNGDGKIDLVTANETTLDATLLLGSGVGSFAFGGAFVLDGPPNGVVALDLNADGKADAAFSIGTADACEVLLGTGAGNFQTPRPFAVIGPARAILAADFNGDGRAELVVAAGTVNKISCLRNQSALPSIVTPPASQAVCQGSTANFSVVATNALSYQWRKNGAPLANGGNISGALTANLAITNVGVSDAAAYDVLVSNAAGTVTSSAGVLTVNSIPNITGQPASQNVCAGTLVSFTVGATGATGFQWRKNAVNIPGANASTYTINSPIVGDTGTYDCLVSNACGSATSNGASLVVVSGVPVFTTNPSSQAVCVGGTASFTVAAAGATAFQWRKNGSNIGGATSTTLLLGPVGLGDAASYDCVASNVCGNVASAAATLTVFSGVPGITINPTPQFACVGGTAAFSVAASNAVAFQWRKNTINIPGATGSTLVISPVAASDQATYDCVVNNSCGATTSAGALLTVFSGNPAITIPPSPTAACVGGSAAFSVVATGVQTYQWRKDGVPIGGATASSLTINPVSSGSAGNYDVMMTNSCGTTTSPAVALTVFTGNPTITIPPSPQVVCVAGSATFSVTATQAQTYQWRKDFANIPGATASVLMISPAALADAGSYDCVVTNSCGSTISGAASLTVNAAVPNITSQPVPQVACSGGAASFSVAATSAVTYQWRKNTTNIPGATLSTYSILGVLPADVGSYDVLVGNGCGTTTSSAATLTVFTGNPGISLPPLPTAACVGGTASFTVVATQTQSYQWRKDGVPIAGATNSTLLLGPIVTGDAGSYDCILTNACGFTPSPGAALTVFTANPNITLQPSPQVACVAGSASFSVAASQAQTYQWRKDFTNIPGATSTALLISPVAVGDAGSYDCVVTNSCGSTTSAGATLTVSGAFPNITAQPSPQAVCVGGAAGFSVTATGAVTYQWRKNTTNIPGATSSTYTILGAQASDAGSYDVVIGNGCGDITSTAAALAVSVGIPTITGNPTPQSVCTGGSAAFNVVALDASGFQWRKDGNPIAGATSRTLLLSPVGAGDAGSYSCDVTNPCGTAASSGASLTVGAGIPTITLQPIPQIVCTGDPVSFSVAATGATGFQWRKDAVDISGATASTYAIGSATSSDAGLYDCVVSNECGPVMSAGASLTISDILYVNAAATGANSGKTWADAFTDLQDALTSSRATVQVWVAAGTYRPDKGTGNRNSTFQLANGKSVFGGFAGGETSLSQRNPKTNPTILSGDIGALGNTADNSLHVVTGSGAGASAILDGFTIRDGNADAGGGGGILIVAGTPTIRGCKVYANRAGTGGGLSLDGAVLFIGNGDFRGNHSSGGGGAISVGAAATLTMVNPIFSGNDAASGGAISNAGTLTLANATLSRNTATGSGGGVRTTGTLTFVNTILWGNSDAGGATEAAQVSVGGGSASGTYSVVQGLAAFAGPGNLGTDPKLVDPDGPDDIVGNADDDLRLTPFSVCIDAGSNAGVPADAADLDGDANVGEPTPVDAALTPRFIDDPLTANTGLGASPLVDIGAREYDDADPTPFGTGTPGCQGTETMGVSVPAKIGEPNFTLVCDKAPPSSLGLGLVTDVPDVAGSDPFAIGVLLHVDLFFSVQVYTLDVVSDAGGTGSVSTALPNNPLLVGTIYYAQSLWFWSSCTLAPFNLSTSRGLKFKILPP